MTFSIYDATVPVLTRSLGALSGILAKGAAHAEVRKILPEVFLTARLAPDMYALTKQVQVVSDMSKGTAARLAGVEAPSYPDDEKSFPELQARLAKSIDFIKGLPAAKFDGADTREIVLNFPTGAMTFSGKDYLCQFALPNIYFHMSMAYGILRHNGVGLAKMDFLGGV